MPRIISRMRLGASLLAVLLCSGCSTNLYSGDLKDVELVRGLLLDNVAAGTQASVLLLARDKALEEQYSDSYYDLTGSGAGLAEAVGELYRHGAKQLNFSHRQVLLLGEEAAGAESWLDWAQRSPEIRPTVYPVICQGQAAKLLEAEADVSPLYLLGNILEPQGSSRPGAAAVRLQGFVELLLAPGIAPVLPVVAVEPEGGVELAGFAVYGASQPAGLLQGDAAYAWQLLLRPGYLAGETLSLDGQTVLQVLDAKVSHQVKVAEAAGASPQVIYKLRLRLQPLTNPQGLAEVELARLAETRLQQIFAAAVSRSRELGLDFLGAGREVWRHKPELWLAEYEQYNNYLNRLELLLEAEVTVEGI